MSVQVEEVKILSFRITGDIQHDAWIKIDSYLFVHKRDFSNDEGLLRDSLLNSGEKLQYYVLPASKLYYRLHTGLEKVEAITPLLVFNRMIMDIDFINKKRPTYKMNIGANLWLNNELELTRVDGRVMQIEFPMNYPVTIK
jgi:hypothetical protein